MKNNGTKNAEYVKLYFQAKKIMTHPQIASSILQQVAEWNNEIASAIKKNADLLAFFRASKIAGSVTTMALNLYLTGARKPPQWVLIALREVVKRHVVPVKRHIKKESEVAK